MSGSLHSLFSHTAVAALIVFCCFSLRAQVRSSESGLRNGVPDESTLRYVSRCLRTTLPRPVEFYSRGGWYVTDDLREQLRERGGSIDGTALVWELRSRPRAVYQWNHDGEFNRDVVACLNAGGDVVGTESRYTPGDSEPDQRWVYVHNVSGSGDRAHLQISSRFTDRDGRSIARPHLTPEDQDFIAGERIYRKWTDFDFAGLVGAPGQ